MPGKYPNLFKIKIRISRHSVSNGVKNKFFEFWKNRIIKLNNKIIRTN